MNSISDIEDDPYEADADDNMLAANDAPIMSPSEVLYLPALFDPPGPSSPPPLEEGSLDPLDIPNNAIDRILPINMTSSSPSSSLDEIELTHNNSNSSMNNSDLI